MSIETSERDYLSHLNPQQQLAVTQTDGPMLILAGAGSGKTRTITYKIAHLIDRELCQPEQVLAVTFTNKAAEEMRNRVQSLLTRAPGAPLLCTFHSFGVRVLRQHADRIGYRRDFTICDREDQMRVLKTVYEELHFTDKELPVRQTLAALGRAKSRDWGPEEYSRLSKDFSSEQIGLAYSAYENFLKQSNAMDFDDLILLTVRLLKENPEVRNGYGEHYRYVLIDEYQDTNRPQYELIKNLTQVHKNITAVGDEDQSIYGFRGADIENILHFEADFPGATIVKLEQNYRSTQTILDAATSVVSNNLNRKGKVLWTDEKAGKPIELFAALEARSEATYVSQKIYQHLNEGTNGIAVLYRTNFQSRQFEEALRRLDVPYKLIGGVSFYHRREVKDALAYLRVVINPGDNVSLMRIINRPTRGIGQMTLDQLHHRAQEHNTTLWAMHSLGNLLRETGELEEAERLGAEAVERGRGLWPNEHPPAGGRFLIGHARTLAALKRFEPAETELLEALAMFEDTGVPIWNRPWFEGRSSELTEGFAELYEAWHAAEPEAGHDAGAAEVRARIQAADAAQPDGGDLRDRGG